MTSETHGLWVICDCCGTYASVMGAMGDWMRTCMRCNLACHVCMGAQELKRWIKITNDAPPCPHPPIQERHLV